MLRNGWFTEVLTADALEAARNNLEKAKADRERHKMSKSMYTPTMDDIYYDVAVADWTAWVGFLEQLENNDAETIEMDFEDWKHFFKE